MNIKHHIKIAVPVFILVMVINTQCKYDKGELLNTPNPNPSDCSTIAAKFSTDVFPLVTSKCAISNCHDGTASGGQVFQNYTQISAAADRINVRAVIEKTMPENGSLTASEINILKCWIASGAPNN